ncbi:hypothetical protein FOZ63_032821 [Perkinsus olseni]|uniref:Uncharacterized protein n=1 Tax=Perkinsus olseni TaxID=32597 RepID=A0A7J6UCQ1_PEROL|nr:hypothetical protein FOZ63_032821 [Perkinsus olseni]KAF4754990.1 hypothetical protein FOZ62_024869 [Perkinsus olseni]
MVSFKLIYSVISLMVVVLARPSPPTGTYYKNINAQGTICAQLRWPTGPHEDVVLGVKCGPRRRESEDLTVDDLRNFVYKLDEHSKRDYNDFRRRVNQACPGLVNMQNFDLFKFEYNPGSQTIKTLFEGTQYKFRPGSCW